MKKSQVLVGGLAVVLSLIAVGKAFTAKANLIEYIDPKIPRKEALFKIVADANIVHIADKAGRYAKLGDNDELKHLIDAEDSAEQRAYEPVEAAWITPPIYSKYKECAVEMHAEHRAALSSVKAVLAVRMGDYSDVDAMLKKLFAYDDLRTKCMTLVFNSEIGSGKPTPPAEQMAASTSSPTHALQRGGNPAPALSAAAPPLSSSAASDYLEYADMKPLNIGEHVQGWTKVGEVTIMGVEHDDLLTQDASIKQVANGPYSVRIAQVGQFVSSGHPDSSVTYTDVEMNCSQRSVKLNSVDLRPLNTKGAGHPVEFTSDWAPVSGTIFGSVLEYICSRASKPQTEAAADNQEVKSIDDVPGTVPSGRGRMGSPMVQQMQPSNLATIYSSELDKLLADKSFADINQSDMDHLAAILEKPKTDSDWAFLASEQQDYDDPDNQCGSGSCAILQSILAQAEAEIQRKGLTPPPNVHYRLHDNGQ